MSERDLRAAGITDPELRASYERCRELNAAHGKTYYLATLLLPPGKRPYVHALYGFARYADEIVDDLSSTLTDQEKSDWLGSWGEAFLSDVRQGHSDDPVCHAVVDTVRRWEIPIEHFEAFLHSMRMDLTVTEYRDLRGSVRVRLRIRSGHRFADGAHLGANRSSRLRVRHETRGLLPAWRTSYGTCPRISTAGGSICRWPNSNASV